MNISAERGNVYTWAEVEVLSVTDTTATTTDRIYTSGPSNRSATGVINNRVLKIENGIEDLEAIKELNEIDRKISRPAVKNKRFPTKSSYLCSS